MADALDTSWFDLKNYEEFRTMSVEGWIWQLEARNYYHSLVIKPHSVSDIENSGFSSIVATLKNA